LIVYTTKIEPCQLLSAFFAKLVAHLDPEKTSLSMKVSFLWFYWHNRLVKPFWPGTDLRKFGTS